MSRSAAYYGVNEVGADDNDPDKFWKKGFHIFANVIRLEGYENTTVIVKHRSLKPLLIDQNIIDFDISSVWYSERDPTSDKYKNADISYPVIMTDAALHARHLYKYVILDGHTRINKAINRGFTSFHGYYIPHEEMEKYMLFWSPDQQRSISIYEQRQFLGK